MNKKAKELAGLLGQNGKRVWVGEAVCFTDNSLRVRLPAHDQNGVYTVTELVEMLKQPPREERRRITAISRTDAAATDLEQVQGPQGWRSTRYGAAPPESCRRAMSGAAGGGEGDDGGSHERD